MGRDEFEYVRVAGVGDEHETAVGAALDGSKKSQKNIYLNFGMREETDISVLCVICGMRLSVQL